jgi:hypothetical protein
VKSASCVRGACAVCVLLSVMLMLVLAPTAGATRRLGSTGWTFRATGRVRLHRPTHRPSTRRRRAHSAIVGGSESSIEHAPWEVALLGEIPVEYEGKMGVVEELCGGAIIGETRVLTADHCMF